MTGDSVKEARARELADCMRYFYAGTVLCEYDSDIMRSELPELLRTLADELEQARRELAALRTSLPAERRKAAEAGLNYGIATHVMSSRSLQNEKALKWLNENYQEGNAHG